MAKFLKGTGATQTEHGDPLGGSTAYRLCVWDDGPNLVGSYLVDRAGDLCSAGSADWWKSIGKAPPDGKGYKYRDKDLASDGISLILLKGGAPGRSQALVKGKGSGVPPVAVALQGTTSVRLQLIGDDAPQCVEAIFSDIKKAEPDFFKAK